MVASKISVCLLSYNHAHILAQIIESVLLQKFQDFELIISDDNSTDDSWNIILTYSTKDKRIIPLKTPYNCGMAANANFCISKSRYDFVALLHHDDILRDDTLEQWINIINKSNNIGFVFNNYLVSNRIDHKHEKREFKAIMKGRNFLIHYLLSGWGCPVRGTALIRKEYFNNVGQMDEKFSLLADVDLWMRLSAKWDVGYVNESLLTILQERPENYPTEYTHFSWKRLLILFNIHAVNIKRVYDEKNIYRWLKFRLKVSFEVAKWLIYGAVRKRSDIIKKAPEGKNDYEFFFVKILRNTLKYFTVKKIDSDLFLII